ncbi:MAG: hypothetical protein H6Q74_744 [Firmicutes bacterium]|nr:hypothetical protein [Bacillota bacterium]
MSIKKKILGVTVGMVTVLSIFVPLTQETANKLIAKADVWQNSVRSDSTDTGSRQVIVGGTVFAAPHGPGPGPDGHPRYIPNVPEGDIFCVPYIDTTHIFDGVFAAQDGWVYLERSDFKKDPQKMVDAINDAACETAVGKKKIEICMGVLGRESSDAQSTEAKAKFWVVNVYSEGETTGVAIDEKFYSKSELQEKAQRIRLNMVTDKMNSQFWRRFSEEVDMGIKLIDQFYDKKMWNKVGQRAGEELINRGTGSIMDHIFGGPRF